MLNFRPTSCPIGLGYHFNFYLAKEILLQGAAETISILPVSGCSFALSLATMIVNF